MSSNHYSRWLMIKNLAIFQIKLACDALRDLLLSPVSFICTFIDIIKQPEQANSYFEQLMKTGQYSDRWLNLFGEQSGGSVHRKAGASHQSVAEQQQASAANVDQLFDKIESILKEQEVNEKLTAAAKYKISQYVAYWSKIQNASAPHNTNESEISAEANRPHRHKPS
ncbi:hypothetical protein tinsulaeT_11520 [Thalassotalea insulae]|uniref:Uncharacterized protein n=1 Tax=Thalassotalea insulae TaxID=2056778 RepID=A0ABQ6GQX2_9GAMM|nr:hypothetical protein [Thalassotalea insulae]GLX77812.1 hypothetical protein tinsulaeT_11520 [Thalassotalea insulae]